MFLFQRVFSRQESDNEAVPLRQALDQRPGFSGCNRHWGCYGVRVREVGALPSATKGDIHGIKLEKLEHALPPFPPPLRGESRGGEVKEGRL